LIWYTTKSAEFTINGFGKTNGHRFEYSLQYTNGGTNSLAQCVGCNYAIYAQLYVQEDTTRIYTICSTQQNIVHKSALLFKAS